MSKRHLFLDLDEEIENEDSCVTHTLKSEEFVQYEYLIQIFKIHYSLIHTDLEDAYDRHDYESAEKILKVFQKSSYKKMYSFICLLPSYLL